MIVINKKIRAFLLSLLSFGCFVLATAPIYSMEAVALLSQYPQSQSLPTSQVIVQPAIYPHSSNTGLSFFSGGFPFIIQTGISLYDNRDLMSQGAQDEKYGIEELSGEIVNTLNEIYNELKQAEPSREFPELRLKKMNPSASYTVAQEYQFVGIHPTNGTFYIDENFLNGKTKECKKFLLKSALLHYLNGTYRKVGLMRVALSAVGTYVVYNITNMAANGLMAMGQDAIKNFFGVDFASIDAMSWHSPQRLIKTIGMQSIASLIMHRLSPLSKPINNFLDKPAQKYLAYINTRIDKESADGVLKVDSKISSCKPDRETMAFQDQILGNRLCTVYKDDLQKNAVLEDLQKKFEALKNNSDTTQTHVGQFLVSCGQKISQDNFIISVAIQKFIEEEVIPYNNSFAQKKRFLLF